MENDAVFAKVKELFVRSFDLEPDSVTPDKRLDKDLELDSLDMVDLVIALNDEKGLLTGQIEPTMFRSAKTVQDVVDIVLPYIR